jgi:hypothetical protein
LDHHGIAWKEITNSKLESFLRTKKDEEFLEFFEPSAIEKKSSKIRKNNEFLNSDPSPVVFKDIDMKIKSFKNSEWYKSFLTILDDKKANEEKAKVILEKNHGRLNPNHLKNVITLVNGSYPYIFDGKKDAAGPWFGQLLSKPNTENIFKTDVVLINNWFKVLKDNNIPVHRRIDILKTEPYKIKGINAGFITLMLYLLDKPVYSIWFRPMHEGLKIIYPEIGNYTGNGAQYTLFNKRAKDFLHQFDFDDTELDWILFSKFKYSRELR